jgi:WD40 repeat protein/serine/threonine protein kinase
MSERDIFIAALQKDVPAQRQTYLDEACAGQSEMRARVESLLRLNEGAGSFLERPAAESTDTGAFPNAAEGALSREAPGALIGPYKLLQQIGEGGMGTVWMAEQTTPVKRFVALKVIKAGMDSRQMLARFEAERQALARMDHPNIARVLDAGTTEQRRPYFVMELVKGVSITRYCDEKRLTPRERLELFIPVCQAVQHAHQKGIIHRDLKPTNILVGIYDAKAVPRIIDFGVAKAAGPKLTEATLFTGFGTVIGTPEYMSPEQAQLDNLDIDTRSDIYSLGVLLYELLTGTTPFTKKDLEKAGLLETLRVIREQEPPKPSMKLSTVEGLPTLAANRGTEPAKLTKLLRGELDWIVMRCLEKDRKRRYETASSLAADVQRYLHDEPVRAGPPSTWYRFRKFVRRNRRAVATAAAACVAVVLAITGLAISTFLIVREQRATEKAKVALQRDTYFHRIALAHHELSADRLGRAVRFLKECPKDLQGWEWDYLTRLCRVEPLVLRAKTEVNGLAFSRGGEFLASAVGDGTVQVWNCQTGAEVRVFRAHAGSVYSVAFHPDGKHLASAGADRKARVWDWATGHEVFNGPSGADHNRGTGCCVAFSPDGRRLAVGSDGAVNVWDWETSRLALPPLRGHAKKGISVTFSPDGRRLASGSWSGEIMIWDAQTGNRLHSLSEHHHPISALAFSREGQRLVSACFNESLIVWDATTGLRVGTLEGHERLVLGVAFSRDGSRIASAGEDKTVRVWETATGREVLDLRGHTQASVGVAFTSDGLRLASGSWDKSVRVWDATPLRGNEAQEALTFPQHGEVWTVAVSPEGRRIASAGLGVESPVKVWDVASGQESVEFCGHQAVVFRVAWHPDGEWVASSGWDGERELFVVKVWNARTGDVGFEVAKGMETPALAFSPNGEYLVTSAANGKVRVWNARTGQEVQPLDSHDRPVLGLVFSGKGGHLASASADGAVRLWDATRLGKEQAPRNIFSARVGIGHRTISFSSDGRSLVAGGEKNTVKIWHVQTGQELQKLDGHSGDVWATVFSPDTASRWVASAGEESTVRIWDSQSGDLLRTFRGHTGVVSSLAFGPDSRWLISGSRDHTVKIWDLTHLDVAAARQSIHLKKEEQP